MFVDRIRRIVPTSWKRAATDREFWLQAKIHLLTRPMYSGVGSILGFHRVCPKPDRSRLGFNKDLEVTPELLEEIIRFFKARGYEFVSLDQVYEILKRGIQPRKFVAFTIDDGYLDNYTHAYPIFKRYDVPFAIYVTNCFPDRTAILWWYVLEEMLWERDELEVELDHGRVRYDFSTLEKKEQVFEIISGDLTFAGSEANVKRILQGYEGHYNSHVHDLALSWVQIVELSKDPLVTIGAHSRRHLALSTLSAVEARDEILESKHQIEGHIGQPVDHFAYPYGGRLAAGLREFQLVKDCQFKTATTTRYGNIFAAHQENLECLPRIPVSGAELGKNVRYLNLWVDGLVPCHENGFQRVITA